MSNSIHETTFLTTLLGTYNPSIYLRTVYVPYDEKDIANIKRQVKTGEPAYKRDEYKHAPSWKDKERILKIFTTAYHEAFHYFGMLITSYGIFEQYSRTGGLNESLKILFLHNGLPDESIQHYIMQNLSQLHPGHPFSRESLLLSGIRNGDILYPSNKQQMFGSSGIFKIIQITEHSIAPPQICIEVDGQLYPFGAKVLMESWAFSAFKYILARDFGIESAEDYSERLGIPTYPYKILERAVRQILTLDNSLDNNWLIAYVVSIIAYYGLNHQEYKPPSYPINESFFPGYRAALLIDFLYEKLKGKDNIGPGIIFDVLGYALELDEISGWSPFMVSSYRTWGFINDFMSKITRYTKAHINTINLGAHARFMGHSETAILSCLSDTAIIFDIRTWVYHYANSNLFRPPISLFIKKIGCNEIPEFSSISDDQEEISFWTHYFIVSSIIEQKMRLPTWKCPLVIFGRSSCEDFDVTICDSKWSSLDIPSAFTQKNCLLTCLLEKVKMNGIKVFGSSNM